jgi:hypothetical protein
MTPDSQRNTLAELFITHLLLGTQPTTTPTTQEEPQSLPPRPPAKQVDDAPGDEVSQT